jgi:hypothetical protein
MTLTGSRPLTPARGSLWPVAPAVERLRRGASAEEPEALARRSYTWMLPSREAVVMTAFGRRAIAEGACVLA